MPLEKMGNFSFDHTNQQDDLYKVMDAQEVKEAFDSRGNELKAVLNKLIDQLGSVADGNSGADNVKMTPIDGLDGNTAQALAEDLKKYVDSIKTNLDDNYYKKPELLSKSTLGEGEGASRIGTLPIPGVLATNVQRALEVLKSQISQAALGNIPDGTITPEKLAFIAVQELDFNTHKSEKASLTTNGHTQLSSATDSISEELAATPKAVKAAYDLANEAKQSANSGKTAIATAVTAKGVTASPADTFPVLATKIGQINTGKRFATGTLTDSYINYANKYYTTKDTNTVYFSSFDVSGLAFKPTIIMIIMDGLFYTSVNTNVAQYAGYHYVDVTGTSVRLINNASIGATSFSLPVYFNGTKANVITWIAFE